MQVFGGVCCTCRVKALGLIETEVGNTILVSVSSDGVVKAWRAAAVDNVVCSAICVYVDHSVWFINYHSATNGVCVTCVLERERSSLCVVCRLLSPTKCFLESEKSVFFCLFVCLFVCFLSF